MISGRTTYPLTLEQVIDHECGHALERVLKGLDGFGDFVKRSMTAYADRISGYAGYNEHEYIAESFCAWRSGDTGIVDPELIKYFERTRR